VPSDPPRTPAPHAAPPGPDEPASRLTKEQFYRHLARRVSSKPGAAGLTPAPEMRPGDEEAPAAIGRTRGRGRPGRAARSALDDRRRRLVVGRHITVRFERMGPDGEAVATVAGRILAVPYAAPGDEATVRLLEIDRARLRGQIVTLNGISTRITRPLCPHFGRCGGCQWQHLDYATQLEQKTLLVRDALRRAGVTDVRVDPAVGWEPPWEFRTRLAAAVGTRAGRPIVGFLSWGGERIVDVRTCPVQHPGGVAALAAARAAMNSLVSAISEGAMAEAAAREDAHRHAVGRAIGQGILRGLLVRVGAATGEVMLGLSTTERFGIAGRAMVVRAFLDSVPGLVSIMEARVQRHSHLMRGRHTSLLWGRPYIQDEAAGVRYHVPLLAEFPSNANAFAAVVEMILAELDPGPADTVIEPSAGIGAYTLHLALAAGRVVGVTGEEWMDAAWENARLNRLDNCVFYTRDPLKALAKVARRWGPVRLAFLRPDGAGLPDGLLRGLRQHGVARLVYLGRSLSATGRDAAALAAAGFHIARVQPVDTSPHTSRLSVLLTAVAR
jgi:23S rRNA (uracil1939-C5)-methyltransferase